MVDKIIKTILLSLTLVSFGAAVFLSGVITLLGILIGTDPIIGSVTLIGIGIVLFIIGRIMLKNNKEETKNG